MVGDFHQTTVVALNLPCFLTLALDVEQKGLLLDNGLKLSNFKVVSLEFLESVNTKNVMTVDIIYALMLHCMIKLRPDLELAHQDDQFDI